MSDTTAEDLRIEEGEAIRLDGCHGRDDRRCYYTVVNGIVLEIGPDQMREVHLDLARQELGCSLEKSTTDLGEAFEFLRGDYKPDIQHFCLGCGSTIPDLEEKSCGCPVGVEIESVDWPTINAAV